MGAWRTLLPCLLVAALAYGTAAQDYCQTDLQCPYAKFCHQPRNAAVSGSCQPCWKCCLFGSSYGTCPDSCNCGVGVTCYSKGNCGDGLFCRVGSNDTEPPRCQPCTACLQDAQSVTGSCSEDCASGALQPIAMLPEQLQREYVFTHFAAADLFTSEEEGWDMAAFRSWLQQEATTSSALAGYASPPGLAPVQIESAFAAFDYSNDGRVDQKEWINASLSLPSSSFLCVNKTGQLYTITYQGCPCTMRGSRGGGSLCAAGLMCTWQPLAGHGPLAASSLLPTAADTSAVCAPCLSGQYCPQGTAYQVTAGPRSAPSLTCPEGYLCPTPAEAIRCQAGAYCPAGSTSSRTCDMGSLSRLGWAGNVTVTQSIVQRLRTGQDQFQGNHCPAGSSSPLQMCGGGFFCPEPSYAVECPPGHFCPPGSSHPRLCKPLSPCPAGTLKPRFSWMFLLLLGFIVAAAAVVWWLLLAWEAWVLAGLGHDSFDAHGGPAAKWASAAGTERQPSMVATASLELQQLLDWYGGPPADVQRSLRRIHIPTASQKKLSGAAIAKTEADAAAAGDVFCELAVPGSRAGGSLMGRQAPRTSAMQASASQYDSSADAPWLIAESPPARQQQPQQQRGRSILGSAYSRPLGEGSEGPPEDGSVLHARGSTPVRVAPLLAATSGGLDAEVVAAASGQSGGMAAVVANDAAAAAAVEEARAQLLAAYGATEQHGRLADLLHHCPTQQYQQQHGGDEGSVVGNSSTGTPSTRNTVTGPAKVPLKEAAYAAIRAPAHVTAATGTHSSSLPHMQHHSSGAEASSVNHHQSHHTQHQQQLAMESEEEEHHAGERSVSRQLSQKAISAVKAAVAVTGRSMRRLAQYRSSMQAVEAAGGGDGMSGGHHTPGSPGSTSTGMLGGTGSGLLTATASGAATSSQGVSPRSASMMNKSAVFQEELLRVQRSARSRQMERSAASWTAGPAVLGGGAVAAGSAMDSSFSGRPGSFTAAGRMGLASAMAQRAGSITGAQWRLAAASAAAMAARKGADSPEEEPIDVAAVPTVAVEFDIHHVSMPQRGAASSDSAAEGADAQHYQCVLNRVQGCFQPYTISCLLGPSGSGKSTLLDVLRGRLLLSSHEEEEQVPRCTNPFRRAVRGVGRVLYDGLPAGDARVTKLVGFVPQDDIIHTDLTVWENLLYGAALRQPQGTTRRDWQELVGGVVSLLALRGVQHSMVGSVERRGISGGQRKRVNIGMELVGQPSVLYLDEPTSGLDANASMSVVKGLQTISRLGMALLLVAHQPRYALFRMFHQALVLGPASELVFCGPPLLAAPYFEALGFRRLPAENPADWLMDIVGGTAVQEAASGHLSMAGPGSGKRSAGWRAGAAAVEEQEAQREMQLAAVWRQRGLAWTEEATRLNRPLLDLATAPAVNLSGATVCLLVNQLAAVLPDPHQKVPREVFCRQLSAPLCWGSLGMDAHAVGQLLRCLGLGEQQLVEARAVELALVASTGTFAADAEGELLLPSWGPDTQRGAVSDAGPVLKQPGTADSSNHSTRSSIMGMGVGVGAAAAGGCSEEPSLHGALPPAHPSSSRASLQQPHALAGSGMAGLGPQLGGAGGAGRSVLGQTRRPASCGSRSSTSEAGHTSSASGSSNSSSRRSSWSSAEGENAAGPCGTSQPAPQQKRQQHASMQVPGHTRPPAVTIPGSPDRGSPAFFDPGDAVQGPPLRSPACTPRTDLLPITPGMPSARSRASQTPTGCVSTPRQQQAQQQRQPGTVTWAPAAAAAGVAQAQLPKRSSCPELTALAEQAPRPRSASPDPSESSGGEGSPLPLRRASHPSGGGLTRSSSLPDQQTPWAAQTSPPPPAAAAARPGLAAVPAGTMTAAPTQAPSQQQLSPREGWQQVMSARHQQQQQQQQAGRSPRAEQRSPSAAYAGAPRNSGAADLVVAERQPSVALKVARLLSGAAASASVAWSNLVGGGSRSGWVDAEQLRQLQEREHEAKQKARHKEEVLAYAAAHQQPSTWRQLRWLLLRGLLKQRRAWTWATPPTPLVDLLLVVGAGLIVGFIHAGSDTLQQAPQQALMTMTTLGVLCSMVHLRTLCGNRVLLLREVESGVGVVPYYVAQVLVDLVWVLLLPLVFTSMYYYTSLPEMPWGTYYAAATGVCWWLSGCAYLVAALLPIRSTTVTGVFLALVFGVFLNGTNPTIADSRRPGAGMAAVRAALSVSFNRWALELLALSEFRMYGSDKQTAVMSICRALGLCRLDVYLPDDGDGALSEREALAYLRLQEAWRPQFCDSARLTALLTLLLGGAVLRVVAGCVLRVTSQLKYWRG